MGIFRIATAYLFFFIFILSSRAGSLDTSFDIGTGASGLVEQVLPLPDGRMLICGNFTSFNGKDRPYIARLNNNGSVDESFWGHPSYWVRNMTLQADGKIVIGGYFKGVGGVPRALVARLNADGSLDASFDPGLGATDLIAAGIDGNVDPFVFWVAVQSDGKILITGNFRNYNGESSVGIARINPDGTRDRSFNVGAGLNSWGRHLLVQSNGQILVSGWFTSYNNQSFNRLVRLNTDGFSDTSFNPFFGDKTAIYSTAPVANNQIIAAGHSLNDQGLFRREFARLNADGSFDPTFVGSSNDKTESIAVQPDGKIIIGGNFSVVDGTPRTSLARLKSDGTLDDTLQAAIDNYVWTVALQGDGKLLISGGFFTVDGVSRNGVARLITGITPGPPPPAIPALSAAAVATNQINLTWTYSASDATGFKIERKTGSAGVYAQIAAVASAVRSYNSTGLLAGTQYFYRIKATTVAGDSPYSNEASATTSSAAAGASASATFAGLDSSTHGSWKGVFGADGYNVIGDSSTYPAYARITAANKSDWTWQWSTADVDALQRFGGTDRIAACWYSGAGFSIDCAITDGQKHRVTLYCLDWDGAGRNQILQVTDGDTGSILNTQTISAFSGGVYVSWDITAHVKITVTPNAGNAVISGIFFGTAGAVQQPVATPTISPNGGSFTNAQTITLSTPTSGAELRYTTNGSEPTTGSILYSAPVTLNNSATIKAKGFKTGMLPSATASASFTISAPSGATAKVVFVGLDGATQGNWRTKYGADGYNVIGNSSNYPLYAQLGAIGKLDWTWNNTTADPRALQIASGTGRVAACWYSGTTFDVDLNFTDGMTHRLAWYLCDWDFAGRSERVDILDAATGAVLHSITASGFSGGQYLVWDIKGRVKIRVTRLSGPNTVISGIFFSSAPTQL